MLIKEAKKRKEMRKEMGESLKEVELYEKKWHKIHGKEIDKVKALKKICLDMQEDLQGQINSQKEEIAKLKAAFQEELDRTYIDHAESFTVLSKDPSHKDYTSLQKRQLSRVSGAQSRHRELGVECINSVYLERALSTDHKTH